MPDESAVTRLVVQGGAAFISTLTDAARSQELLTNAIRSASQLAPANIGRVITEVAQQIEKSSVAAEKFKEKLAEIGVEEAVIQRVTGAIQGQTKALLENNRVIEEARQKELDLQNTREANRRANLSSIPTTQQRSLIDTPQFGAPTGKFLARGSDEAITQALAQQQIAFFEKQAQIRQNIEDRATKASELRAQNRAKIANDEAQAIERANARIQLVQTARLNAEKLITEQETRLVKERERQQNLAASSAATNAERQKTIEANFRRQNPIIANGPTTLDTAGQQQARNLAAGINEQDAAQTKANNSARNYLASLSATHAATTLLTGSTLGLFQNLGTLGLAFGRSGQEAGGFSFKAASIGVGLGLVLSGVNNFIGFLTGSISAVINLVTQGIEVIGKFGVTAVVAFGAAAAASIQLASKVEDVFAEIAAFGEPTKAQFVAVEAQVSNLARTFGIAASAVGEGASLFIRAGGQIEGALSGGIDAVTKLVIASRGELIPQSAARSIVTVTNSFKQFNTTATDALNIIVGTAQKTALSFSEVTQAFQQAAPQAAELGINLLDLSATIGVLANNGLRGQVAGTGLKQVLLDLLRPSKEARAALEQYGVSIEDNKGKIRPLRDVLIDLNVAFGQNVDASGKVADAAKAQAIAVIFGSRANLAASIIARTGAKAFDELRDAIGGVDASEVVSTLLSATSAQVSIFKTNIEELARAFGGPLNVAIGTALKSVNAFLQGIDRGGFEKAGQAVLAVITGQGFGPIQEALSNLDNAQAKEFFEGILNSALTVRNVIVSELIPAFQTAGTNIANALGTVDITGKFNGVTGAITTLISAGSRLTIFISELISDFITGNERGQGLRTAVEGIATAIKGALVGALLAVVVPLATGVALLKIFGDTVQSAARKINELDAAAKAIQLQTLGTTSQIAQDRLARVSSQLETASARSREFERRTLSISEALKNSSMGTEQRQELIDMLAQLDVEYAQANAQTKALTVEQANLAEAASRAATALASESAKKPIFDNLKFDEAFNMDSFLHQLEGDIPNAMTALSQRLNEINNTIDRGTPDRETAPAFSLDPKKEEQIARETTQIIRAAERETLDLINDAATKEVQLRRQTIDKLIDLSTTYHRNREKLILETDRRIAESDKQFAQGRTDRDRLQIVQRSLELESFLREQANSRRNTLIAQADANDDRREQRRVQDADRILGQTEQREQRSEDIKNAIRDRAFSRQQQNEDLRFSRTQSREEEAFERTLQDQATARQNSLRLKEAKTPEDKLNLQKEIAQGRQDTIFSRSQDVQRRKFRESQEDARIKFTRSQEDAAFQKSLTNEQQIFDFKVQLELKYLAIRRDLEDKEVIRQNRVELDRQQRSFGFSKEDFGFRLGQSDKLQTEQDKIADEGQERQRRGARLEQSRRLSELDQTFSENVFALFDDAGRQSLANQESNQRRLRDIVQRGTEQLNQLQEREGARPGITTALLSLQVQVARTDLLFINATKDAQTFFDVIRTGTLEGEGVPLEAPRRSINFATPDLPAEVQQQLLNATTSLRGLPQELVNAVRDAQLNSVGDRTVQVLGNVLGNEEFLQDLMRALVNQR